MRTDAGWSGRRLRRRLGIIGCAGLLCIAASYYLTCEPAPAVRVRWTDFTPLERQRALEREYHLVPQTEDPTAYDLLDTRSSNIEALVNDPQVADTNDIDRRNYVIPFDTPYGERWMWVADRTPGLRDLRVRWTILVVFAAMALAGAGTTRP